MFVNALPRITPAVPARFAGDVPASSPEAIEKPESADKPLDHGPEIQRLLHLLADAKSFDAAAAGESYIDRNPHNHTIFVQRKEVMGNPSTVFHPNGQVTLNLAPAQGGTKELLPAGAFDFSKAEEALENVSK